MRCVCRSATFRHYSRSTAWTAAWTTTAAYVRVFFTAVHRRTLLGKTRTAAKERACVALSPVCLHRLHRLSVAAASALLVCNRSVHKDMPMECSGQ